jgi:hypothetical protein
MSDLGSQLTKMFGDYKSTQVTVQKTATNTEHHRSSTTNSYDKCIRELGSKFPDGAVDIAIKAIDKYDQSSFHERVVLGEITKFNENTGERYVAGKNVLHIVGEYSFKWFAHCKTIEMWVEVESC